MQRRTIDPAIQPIKGIFIFKKYDEADISQAMELLKSLQCDVLTVNKNKFTITTSRGKLREIKECWLSPSSTKLNNSLRDQVENIIIGGNHR